MIILAIWASISTAFLLPFLVQYLDAEGIIMFRKEPTAYFYPADLKGMRLPSWYVTNTIPLTPDQAVLAAVRHLGSTHPKITSWDVDSIELRKQDAATWTYNLTLTDRQSGSYQFAVVRVLMDGSIWMPSAERRRL